MKLLCTWLKQSPSRSWRLKLVKNYRGIMPERLTLNIIGRNGSWNTSHSIWRVVGRNESRDTSHSVCQVSERNGNSNWCYFFPCSFWWHDGRANRLIVVDNWFEWRSSSKEDALQAFVNKLWTYVFFTKDLLKLLYAPNLTLACITFFTIRSVRVLRPGNLLIYCSRCHAAWQFCPIDWWLDLHAPNVFLTWCLAHVLISWFLRFFPRVGFMTCQQHLAPSRKISSLV